MRAAGAAWHYIRSMMRGWLFALAVALPWLAWSAAPAPGQTLPSAVDPGVQVYEGQIVGENRRPGDMQVNVVRAKKLDNMRASGKDDAPIIWRTPTYADYNWTAHPELEKLFGAGFINKLQKALVDCTDKSVLEAFQRSDLIEAKNADFQGIADVAKALNLLR